MEGRGFQLKDTEPLNLTNVLKDAWSILEMVTENEFLNKLLEKSSLAWKTFCGECMEGFYDTCEFVPDCSRGEMLFQQLIGAPFSKLLLAAGGAAVLPLAKWVHQR